MGASLLHHRRHITANRVPDRLRIELEQGAEFSAIIERRAGRIAGALLFVLAAYIIASAAVGLWERRGQEFSLLGLAVTLLAIPMMVALSKPKIRIAEQIGSRALRADAFEAIACSYLAVIVVAGLIAQWLFGAWWIDSVTSLAIVGFLIKEGREAWFDEDAGDEVGRCIRNPLTWAASGAASSDCATRWRKPRRGASASPRPTDDAVKPAAADRGGGPPSHRKLRL